MSLLAYTFRKGKMVKTKPKGGLLREEVKALRASLQAMFSSACWPACDGVFANA